MKIRIWKVGKLNYTKSVEDLFLFNLNLRSYGQLIVLVFKDTSYINDSIIDKQSPIN
jgi:hypothetical protein